MISWFKTSEIVLKIEISTHFTTLLFQGKSWVKVRRKENSVALWLEKFGILLWLACYKRQNWFMRSWKLLHAVPVAQRFWLWTAPSGPVWKTKSNLQCAFAWLDKSTSEQGYKLPLGLHQLSSLVVWIGPRCCCHHEKTKAHFAAAAYGK